MIILSYYCLVKWETGDVLKVRHQPEWICFDFFDRKDYHCGGGFWKKRVFVKANWRTRCQIKVFDWWDQRWDFGRISFFDLRRFDQSWDWEKFSQLFTRVWNDLNILRFEIWLYIPPYLLLPRWIPSSWRPWVGCGSWIRRPSSVTWRICSRIWKPSSMLA